MKSEHFIHENDPQIDLDDQEVGKKLLEKGNPEDLKKLSEYHNIPYEKIELYSYYGKLRKEVVDAIHHELSKREKENTKATSEELNLGAYKEMIEPQIREAVLLLRKKGYSTFESGFYGGNIQVIGLIDNGFENLNLEKNVLEFLENKNIEIEIRDDRLTLYLNSKMSLPQIKEVWDYIANQIPDKGFHAPESNIQSAQDFRGKQADILT